MVLVPLPVNPDTPEVAVAVQANVDPATLEVRFTSVELPPEQLVCVNVTLETVGFGLTRTV